MTPVTEFIMHAHEVGRAEVLAEIDGEDVGHLALARWDPEDRGPWRPPKWHDDSEKGPLRRACRRGIRKALAAFARRGVDPATVQLWQVAGAEADPPAQGIGTVMYEEALHALQTHAGPSILTAQLCLPWVSATTSTSARGVWRRLERDYVGGPWALTPFPRRRSEVVVAERFAQRLVAGQTAALIAAGGDLEAPFWGLDDGDKESAFFDAFWDDWSTRDDYLGVGATRAVFAAPGGRYVVKVAHNHEGPSANQVEVERWLAATPRTRKHLAPVVAGGGDYVVMRRAATRRRFPWYVRAMWVIEDDPAFEHLHDLDSPDNWGMLNDRPVLIDYGYLR